MLLSRYLAGFKKQACDNSLMKQLDFSPGSKRSLFSLVFPVICFSRFKRRCSYGLCQLRKYSFPGKAQ